MSLFEIHLTELFRKLIQKQMTHQKTCFPHVYDENYSSIWQEFLSEASQQQAFPKNFKEGLWVSILIPRKANKVVIDLFKKTHTSPPLYVTWNYELICKWLII